MVKDNNVEDCEVTLQDDEVTLKVIHLMSIQLKYSQSITVTLVKETDTSKNESDIYVSVGNITSKEIKSVELYLDNQFITEDTHVSKYTSGILSIDNLKKLFNASELKVIIHYLDNNTVEALVEHHSLSKILELIKH